MTVLVTGGAGYIGSHVVRALTSAGLKSAVVDDLSSGRRDFVGSDIPFLHASILQTSALRDFMTQHDIRAVIHLAGFKYAGVSVERPLHTYEQNVQGTASVLQAMADTGVTRMVFSSSAAVYGTPDVAVVTETTATTPESPYGQSKLIGEWLIAAQAKATGLRHTSLRYFNVVGSASDDLYDTSPHNLFPLVINALVNSKAPVIFGDDYPTPDGTCVRDYVHVGDLAEAHVVATQKLLADEPLEPVYNLGSGNGASVREIMDAVSSVSGISFEPTIADRRPGDPARIVASGDLASRDLKWSMNHSIDDMVRGAWLAVNGNQA